MSKFVVVDYGVGNVSSILKALRKVTHEKVILTKDPNELFDSAGVVLPGVGAFGYGMERIVNEGLDIVLREYINNGGYLMGICLGMQMLFESSTEFGNHKGLGLIPGHVSSFKDLEVNFCRLPHVGWNTISEPRDMRWDDTILAETIPDQDVYFVHSYFATPKLSEDVLSLSKYGDFLYCSSVQHNNIYGCQFHPEKSGPVGLNILKKFIKICGENNE
ncbi:MAG: imidazole glycerol phosphate synthase subunit HisH [Porticoccaceae bacterium]